MVQELNKTPGFTPVEPSVVPQDQTVDPNKTGSVPDGTSPEAPLDQQTDQPPAVGSEALRGTIDPMEKEAAKVSSQDPEHSDSQTPAVDSSVPNIEIPDLSSVLDSLVDDSWGQDVEEIEAPVLSNPTGNPELEGYDSVLARLTRPEDTDVRFNTDVDKEIQSGTTPFKLAEKMVGKTEQNSSKVLSAFFKKFGGNDLDPQKTAWCAAFVNAVLGQAGQQGTGKLNARSYLDWGEETKQPKIGDVVVLWRNKRDGPLGHVGFYAGPGEKGRIKILGGNQSDSVSIAEYSKDRILSFRKPPKAEDVVGS